MAKEIERKFLVTSDSWRSAAAGETIRQGYVWASSTSSLRVRLAGDRAFLTLKGAQSGRTRSEYEYQIPRADASEMLESMCQGRLIEKTRYTLEVDGREWVVDVFAGENAGLLVAEVELEHEDEEIELPPWVGREVTADPRYLNVNLMARPFRQWTPSESAIP